MAYQLARYFNIVTYATYLVLDSLMRFIFLGRRNFLAHFFSDLLATVLVTAYALSDLSETTHKNLVWLSFVAGWIWPFFIVCTVPAQWAAMGRQEGTRTFSIGPDSAGIGIMVMVTHSKPVVFMGRHDYVKMTSGVPLYFWPAVNIFNVGYGLALLIAVVGYFIQ